MTTFFIVTPFYLKIKSSDFLTLFNCLALQIYSFYGNSNATSALDSVIFDELDHTKPIRVKLGFNDSSETCTSHRPDVGFNQIIMEVPCLALALVDSEFS